MMIEKRPLWLSALLILLVPIMGMGLGVALTLPLQIEQVFSSLIINICFLTAVIILIRILKPSLAELGLQLIPEKSSWGLPSHLLKSHLGWHLSLV